MQSHNHPVSTAAKLLLKNAILVLKVFIDQNDYFFDFQCCNVPTLYVRCMHVVCTSLECFSVSLCFCFCFLFFCFSVLQFSHSTLLMRNTSSLPCFARSALRPQPVIRMHTALPSWHPHSPHFLIIFSSPHFSLRTCKVQWMLRQ